MEKISFEKSLIFFVSLLIASNTGFYILGKTMASQSEKAELFSTPLLIAIGLFISVGMFTVFRKKKFK
ncbi:uncharacterized protein (UPF0333 family) [Flavobacterium sp. HSC-32F16]|uniref:hypothetical protein n=1 Tax=Flavobacterium sp. HSC-32F16 TaxID=2910964 RepID=UPI0020A4281D|nr:hypothetical protein [Flavobacterium sp. HSC-32F16]MCP2026543.1 uncharacterized protein (UPF0333 family) [Flavobacterium sp. HSC-32F16]